MVWAATLMAQALEEQEVVEEKLQKAVSACQLRQLAWVLVLLAQTVWMLWKETQREVEGLVQVTVSRQQEDECLRH